MNTKYVSDYNEAVLYILHKLIELDEKHPTNLVGIDNNGLANGHALSNYFQLNEYELIIKSDLFQQVIFDLSNKTPILKYNPDSGGIYDYYNEVADEFYKKRKSAESLLITYINFGRKYPTTPPKELLQEIILSFQIQSLDLIKKEIQKILEKLPNKNEVEYLRVVKGIDEIKYQVEYNKKREIRINGILISKPDFCSQNWQAFEYIFNHPNQIIRRKDIQGIEKEFHKDLTKVIADLGFKRQLKELFFSESSKDALRFINPVTTDHLKLDEFKHLNNLDIKAIIESMKPRKK